MLETSVRSMRPRAADLPRFQRVTVTVNGRYMLPDQREYPCTLTSMSPGDCWVEGPETGVAGARVIAYLDQLGRIEGSIGERGVRGFLLDLDMSPRKRDKLAAQLTWLANKDALALPEDRRHERVVPTTRFTELKLDDGRAYPCRIIDISLSGAGVEIKVRPAIGTLASVGRIRARVVRHFSEGIGLEFLAASDGVPSAQPQGLATIEAALRPV